MSGMVRIVGSVDVLERPEPSDPDSFTGANERGSLKLARSGDRSDKVRVWAPENFLRFSFGILRLPRSAALRRSSSALCRVVMVGSSPLPPVTTVCRGCRGSICLISAFFLCDSCDAHCLFRFFNSHSALVSSSFNSRTRLSWAASATRNPLESFGVPSGKMSAGVAGNDGMLDDVGVGLEDSLLFVVGATGKLRDNRFGLRGLYDNARE
jgi:hypothetical protein